MRHIIISLGGFTQYFLSEFNIVTPHNSVVHSVSFKQYVELQLKTMDLTLLKVHGVSIIANLWLYDV